MFQTKVVWFGGGHKKIPLILGGVVRIRSKSHFFLMEHFKWNILFLIPESNSW